jgi:hypothetical protein
MSHARTPLSLATLAMLVAGLTGCNALSPGNTDTATDPSGGSTASDTGNTPTEGMGIQDVTIYDIQQGKVTDKTVVELKNVIVTSPIFYDKKLNGNFFISELGGGPFSGIQVYVYADVIAQLETEGNLPTVGDTLDLRALYSEFFDYSELTLSNVVDMTITGTGKLPTPDTVAAADIATGGAKSEDYEGCLVQIANAKVTAPVVMYGEFEVDGALKVDDLFFVPSPGPTPPVDTTFTSLVGQVIYSFEEFKLAPRTCADYQGYDGCSDPVDTDTGNTTGATTTDTTTGPAAQVTIYDIQMGTVPDKSGVLVKDVIVSSPVFYDKNMNANFFLTEAAGGEYSGIQVYVYADVAMALEAANMMPKQGDKLDIEGLYSEFFDYSEITLTDATNLTITGTGTLPAPSVVLPADVTTGGAKAENYEGCLVSVENVAVTAPVVMYGEFTVDNSLIVDDLFFAPNPGPMPAMGDMFASITGLMTYSFEVFKLEPRTADDLKAQ